MLPASTRSSVCHYPALARHCARTLPVPSCTLCSLLSIVCEYACVTLCTGSRRPVPLPLERDDEQTRSTCHSRGQTHNNKADALTKAERACHDQLRLRDRFGLATAKVATETVTATTPTPTPSGLGFRFCCCHHYRLAPFTHYRTRLRDQYRTYEGGRDGSAHRITCCVRIPRDMPNLPTSQAARRA